MALSEDDQRLLTTGKGGSKLWNPSTGVCLNTVATGYGLCCLFAPGSRFAVVGTHDGKIDVVDLGSSEVVEQVDAHSSHVRTLQSTSLPFII